jgi:hypothetical protein
MGFGHLSSPAFFNGVVGPLLQGINHGLQRCRSYLDDISGGAKGVLAEGFALFEKQCTAATLVTKYQESGRAPLPSDEIQRSGRNPSTKCTLYTWMLRPPLLQRDRRVHAAADGQRHAARAGRGG